MSQRELLLREQLTLDRSIVEHRFYPERVSPAALRLAVRRLSLIRTHLAGATPERRHAPAACLRRDRGRDRRPAAPIVPGPGLRENGQIRETTIGRSYRLVLPNNRIGVIIAAGEYQVVLDLGIRQIPVGHATLAKRLQTGAWRPLEEMASCDIAS